MQPTHHPTTPFKDLAAEEQQYVLIILRYFSSALGLDILDDENEGIEKALIWMLDTGHIKLCFDAVTEDIRMEFWDYVTGRYQRMGRPRAH